MINLSNTFNFLQHLTVFWLFPTIYFYYFKICASPIPQKITQFTGFTKSCFSNSARWALNSALESFHVPLRNCYISFPFFQIPSTLPPSFSADYNSTPYFMGGRGGRREVRKEPRTCVSFLQYSSHRKALSALILFLHPVSIHLQERLSSLAKTNPTTCAHHSPACLHAT